MDTRQEAGDEELHTAFLAALHEEKTRTQAERANYIASKLAFVTGLFGVGSLRVSGTDFHYLLYLIPLVAIGYDLYVQAADSSIKKMGAFLRAHPSARTSQSERDWEEFSARYRDRYAPVANTLVTYVVTLAAAVLIYVQRPAGGSGFWAVFIPWLIACLAVETYMYASYRGQVGRIDAYRGPGS